MGSPTDRSSAIHDRLATLVTDEGLFAILAIDHGRSIQNLLDGDGSEDHSLVGVKGAVLDLLASRCSAVLVDVDMVAPSGGAWRPPVGVGLIVGLDEYDYDDVLCPPPTVPSPELLDELARSGAGAAKVVLYFDPSSADAAERLDAATRVADRCHATGLPLLIEPLPHPDTERTDKEPWPVAEVTGLVAATGADILKLPLVLGPDVDEVAAAITRAAGATPWILLSSGAPFAEFLEVLGAALRGGATGFAAGRSIWGDLISNVSDGPARHDAAQRWDAATTVTRASGRTLRA